jgi:hypothetical protein
MYKVKLLAGKLAAEVRSVLNPLRGPTQSAPGVPISSGLPVADELFAEFGLSEYIGCVTAEMKQRPIPHVFRESETQALTNLYIDWLPDIISRIVKELVPPTQPFNKKSRLGFFRFDNPANKERIIKNAFFDIANNGLDSYQDAFTITNVRLQAESRLKVREALFLSELGNVSLEQVTQERRTVKVRGFGPRTCSRVRLIFNLPIPNLYKQVYDTAAHNVLLSYPAFHHDMFVKGTLPVRGYHLCFDVKSFERYTATAVRARAAFVGGFYAETNALFTRIPFATQVGDSTFFIWPDRQAGWADQFSSGDSAVAPVQKEIFTAIYASFVAKEFHLQRAAAIQFVWAGGDDRLTIRNYGDDNSISGDKEIVLAFLTYAQQFLKAEPEDPPKFLGFEWNAQLGKWELPVSSYLLKTWLNERRPFSRFRRYPNLGWFQKRKVFTQYGARLLKTHVFPREDELLEKIGLSWQKVLERANSETESAQALHINDDPNELVLEREYALTAEQKLATGDYFGLLPDETKPILNHLVKPELRKLNQHLT